MSDPIFSPERRVAATFRISAEEIARSASKDPGASWREGLVQLAKQITEGIERDLQK